LLTGLRILELSQPQTMLAGLILADLGADVIVVEPTGGAPGRRMGPFLDGRVGLERSLTWHALNRNKRSVTLDLDSADGQAALRQLAQGADALLETAPARFADLADTGLVHGLVRPFSADGPKAGYAWTDRTLVAAAGVALQTGDGDRAPLFVPVPQAMHEAGAEAAIALLAGLAARDRDATGQRVQVCARAAAMMSAFSLPYYADTPETPPRRGQGRRAIGGVNLPGFMPCQDGFVQVSIAFGGFGGITRNMARWAVDQGTLAPPIADVDWTRFPIDESDPQCAAQLSDLIAGLRTAFAERSKQQIGEAARAHGFFAAPLLDMSDVAAFAQYRERGLWLRQPLNDDIAIDVPAQVMRVTDHTTALRRPAPCLSEHTQELLGEAGFSDAEVQALFIHHLI
jgi:crotonobetainyl-CoA:carnitine CoA-transferase CaiB-like acyl-CoA transferase